jgi:sporulation protein YlmC with PRC-barrel domain
MLRREEELYGFALQGPDGTIGRIQDFYFDEQTWKIRYLLVKTSDWPIHRRVFVAPAVLESCLWERRAYSALLTKKQVEKSPDVVLGSRLSCSHFAKLDQYYGWNSCVPNELVLLGQKERYPVLSSIRELLGYSVDVGGTEIGPVEDVLIDDGDWRIRYLAVATGEWSRGQRRLVRQEWIGKISRPERRIYAQVGPEPVAVARRHYKRLAH